MSAFFISSLFLFSCLINVLLAQGNIANSCSGFHVDGNVLLAWCIPDTPQQSRINLDRCVTNNNGYLEGNPELVYLNTTPNSAYDIC